MHWLAIVLLVILVVIVAFLLYGAISRKLFMMSISAADLAKIQLTGDAEREFNNFVIEHADLAAHEARKTGVESIQTNPAKYFATELVEPEHQETADLTRKNNWVINEAIMRLWMQEELQAFKYKKYL
jgi:hypothetical protein